MARLYISLLGSYQIQLDGVPLSGFDSDKTRLLLAYLAVEAGKSHRRDYLVGFFWPEQPEAAARRSLSQALYNLRQLLERPSSPGEAYILTDTASVQFNLKSSDVVDVQLFDRLITDCEKHAHRYLEACPECLERLEEANALYRGDFLADFPINESIAFEEWVLMQREHLHRQALMLLTTLGQCYENRGQVQKALEIAHHQVELDPLWEAGQRCLMRLLALDGEYNQALAGYETYKRLLENELAVPPEKETQVLAEQIRRDARSEESLVPFPVSVTPLIGRRAELADLHCYLHDPTCRLLTILGPGGSGKTRLALEEAHRQQYQFRDGVYFIPLSSLGVEGSLLAVIADSLGYTFDEAGNKKQQLLDYMSYKQVLLVLDSFETIMSSTWLVAEILVASPASKVLATSRVQLNLSVEQVYPLEGMDIPPEGTEEEVLSYSAAQLFLEAARRVDNDYKPDELAGVASVCRVVGGMPLSLLLASSWVREYSAQEIAAKIGRSLDFLSVAWADLPERQRSLRATYEYSWNMLSVPERHALSKLSVFRAPFTLEAAEQVAGASPRLLRDMVGKSLLGTTSQGRYQMHDLVRQFNTEKLTQMLPGMEINARQKHAEYFLERVLEWKKIIGGALKPAFIAKIEEQVDDAQAAWDWAAKRGDIDWLRQAMGGLLAYYGIQYRDHEREHACRVALEGIKDSPIDGRRLYLESRFLSVQAGARYRMGHIDIAHQLLDLSQEKLDQARAVGEDVRLGQAAIWGNFNILAASMPGQLDYLKRCADLHKELGNLSARALALENAGEIARFLPDRKLAFEFHRLAVEISKEIADPDLTAGTLMELAYDYLIFGPCETGLEMMKEAFDAFMATGLIDGPAMAEVHLAAAMGYSGYMEESCKMMEPALVTARRLGYHYLIVVGILNLAVFQMMLGKYEEAYLNSQEALKLADKNKFAIFSSACWVLLGILKLKKGEIIQAAEDFRRVISLTRQVGGRHLLCLALGGLALVQHSLGQKADSLASLQEALRISKETHCRWVLSSLPVALVVILVDRGEWELAIEAFAAVVTDPMVSNSRLFPDMIGNRMKLAWEHLPIEAARAAEARGRDEDLFDVLGRLAVEMETWNKVPAGETLGE